MTIQPARGGQETAAHPALDIGSERATTAPIGCAGDSRAALRRDRRRADAPRRRGCDHPARRGAGDGDGGAAAAEGSRRLRDQRRDAAGQAGRHQPTRIRRAGPGAARGHRGRGRRRGRRPGVPQHHRRCRRPGHRRGPDRRGRGGVRHTQTLAGNKINVEFISANPTGPIHLGHTRWAVVGDAIARVLEAAGAEVTREFYINDRGNQMNLFGASLEAAARGQPIPEDGYHGDYIAELAAEDRGRRSRASWSCRTEERMVAFREAGLRPPARGAAGAARRVPDPLRRLVLRAVPARQRRRRVGPGEAARARATCSTRTVRCGCGPPTSATTRTGC